MPRLPSFSHISGASRRHRRLSVVDWRSRSTTLASARPRATARSPVPSSLTLCDPRLRSLHSVSRSRRVEAYPLSGGGSGGGSIRTATVSRLVEILRKVGSHTS